MCVYENVSSLVTLSRDCTTEDDISVNLDAISEENYDVVGDINPATTTSV